MIEITALQNFRNNAEAYLKNLLMGMENHEYDLTNVKVAYNKTSPCFVHVAHKVSLDNDGNILVHYTENNKEAVEGIENVLYTEQVLKLIEMIEL